MLPLTAPEVRRLLLVLTRPIQERSYLLHWSRWRRRHQMRAKRCHYRSRGATFDG
ncbi:MAG: hypothetical protein LC674_05815 [Actinobacteria bacterium]|nr:hypothetical protein [Actinomycetota bacterium]